MNLEGDRFGSLFLGYLSGDNKEKKLLEMKLVLFLTRASKVTKNTFVTSFKTNYDGEKGRLTFWVRIQDPHVLPVLRDEILRPEAERVLGPLHGHV